MQVERYIVGGLSNVRRRVSLPRARGLTLLTARGSLYISLLRSLAGQCFVKEFPALQAQWDPEARLEGLLIEETRRTKGNSDLKLIVKPRVLDIFFGAVHEDPPVVLFAALAEDFSELELELPKCHASKESRCESLVRWSPAQGLTVGEQIRFSADLRNPKETPASRRKLIYEDVLEVMQLSLSKRNLKRITYNYLKNLKDLKAVAEGNIQNSIVGGLEKRGISGGAK